MKRLAYFALAFLLFACSSKQDELPYSKESGLLFELPQWARQDQPNPFVSVGKSQKQSDEISFLKSEAQDSAKTALQGKLSRFSLDLLQKFFASFQTPPPQELLDELSVAAPLPVLQNLTKLQTWVGGNELFYVLVKADKESLKASLLNALDLRLFGLPSEAEFLRKRSEFARLFDDLAQNY
ncbi:MAG: hypothetical protein ACTTIC_06670 [Helicobacteraceae bacterium]